MARSELLDAREEVEKILRSHHPTWTPDTIGSFAGAFLRLPRRDRERIAALLADEGQKPTGPRVRVMADVEPEEVRWLWGARIPRGKLSEIVGDPGEGKSWLTIALVGLLTTGRPLPGDPDFDREPETVLLLSAEDGPGDTIRPRLDAAGADVSRVHLLEGVTNAQGHPDPVNLKDGVHRLWLADLVGELGAGVVVIDPLSAFLGDTDAYRDNEVRSILAPLADMAERTGAAVLAVRHLTKGSATRAIYRAGGSIGFTGSARASMLVGRVEEGSEERAVIVIKSNLAAFPDPVGFTLEEGAFRWTGTPKVTAGDLLRGDGDPDDRHDRADTVTWLRALLEDGPQASVDVLKAAERELGVSRSTVHRARRSMGPEVVVERINEPGADRGSGRWIWSLSSIPSRVSGPVPKRDTLERDTLEQPLGHKGFPPSRPSRVSHTENDTVDTLEGFGDLFAGGEDNDEDRR